MVVSISEMDIRKIKLRELDKRITEIRNSIVDLVSHKSIIDVYIKDIRLKIGLQTAMIYAMDLARNKIEESCDFDLEEISKSDEVRLNLIQEKIEVAQNKVDELTLEVDIYISARDELASKINFTNSQLIYSTFEYKNEKARIYSTEESENKESNTRSSTDEPPTGYRKKPKIRWKRVMELTIGIFMMLLGGYLILLNIFSMFLIRVLQFDATSIIGFLLIYIGYSKVKRNLRRKGRYWN